MQLHDPEKAEEAGRVPGVRRGDGGPARDRSRSRFKMKVKIIVYSFSLSFK